jgi:predicted HAD superfamily Cof-like phosphohydrolase
MRSVAEMVLEFHEVFGCAVNNTSRTTNQLRADLIREEAREVAEAAERAARSLEAGDLGQMARELADLTYVTYGACITVGIDLDRAVAAVHAANLSKLGPDGKPIMRPDGKVLKGPGYRPPDMSAALQGARS